MTQPELSIIVPALNEEDNVAPLVEQVRASVIAAGTEVEMIVVDDGSTDGTLSRLRELCREHAWLRVLHRSRPMGQSAAMHAGIQTACGKYVAVLDADLQNDPADLPPMLQLVRSGQADMVQGDRSHARNDNIVRRCSSWVGRMARRIILGDLVRDTGCSARVVRIELARQFPLQFKGMHRFLPAYAKMVGARVVEMRVNHRPRHSGVAKYGVWNRGLVGLFDCLAVRWMLRRYRDPSVIAMAHHDPSDAARGRQGAVSDQGGAADEAQP